MPRKLPWMQQGGPRTVTRSTRPPATTSRPSKRPKVVEEQSSDVDFAETVTPRKGKAQGRPRTPSTSPPPEPPPERFMDEGMEHDDKYRMVEDEFLTVAQRFTVHLHAAEYKRQQKVVKARNAETISTISRPVTHAMPDQTRRKVESIALSKSQQSAIDILLKKKAEADDSASDGECLPYAGTTLHGLMDSPRKKAASLLKVQTIKAATRAAAGFQKSAAQSRSTNRVTSESSLSTGSIGLRQASKPKLDSSTESSDEDDDLDAPINAPKLEPLSRPPRTKPVTLSSSRPIISSSSITLISRPMQTSNQNLPKVSFAGMKVSSEPSLADVDPPFFLSGTSGRLARRQEQARLKEASQAQEEQKNKKLDVIPTFL